MSEDVVLVAGTLVEQQLANGSWSRIPSVSSTGATGEKAESKEKTTVGDKIKKYGTGLQEAPEKTFKLQTIPVQEVGAKFEADYLLQQAFISRAKLKEAMQMRITWPDLERATFVVQTLGYEVDDASAEDWKMATITAKQNSETAWGVAPALTDLTVTGSTAFAVASTESLSFVPVPLDAYYVADVTYSSSDTGIVTVSEAGVMTGISAGTADITVTMSGVSKVHSVTVS